MRMSLPNLFEILLTYYNGGKMNKKFYELQFEIENACLLNCIHCSSLEMRHGLGRTYSIDDLTNFVSIFSENVYIYFTGGEPLLFKDLIPVCKRIKELTIHTSIGLYTTGNCKNGVPISVELAAELFQAGIEDCYFSIYSDNEEEHDSWTKTPGSYYNTIKSISNVKSHGIKPKAHLVLNQYNKGKIEEVIVFCQRLGLEEIRILKLTPTGSAKFNWEHIGIPLEEQNKIIHNLIFKRDTFSVKLSFSGFPDLYPCRSWDHAKGCQAGTHLLYIDEKGYVYPCACTKRNPDENIIASITDIEQVRQYIQSKEQIECNEACLNESGF